MMLGRGFQGCASPCVRCAPRPPSILERGDFTLCSRSLSPRIKSEAGSGLSYRGRWD